MKKQLNSESNIENEKKEVRKYSYDELKSICDKLYQEQRGLVAQLQQMQNFIASKRLDFLFRVVEMSDKFGDAEFVTSCINEIKETMTIPETEEQES